MKPVKALLIPLAALILIGATVWQFWLKGQVEFAKVATAYGAKQVCSCVFVAEREFDSCLGDFTEDVSQVSFSVSSSEIVENGAARTDQTVMAQVLGGMIRNRARFEPGLGCTLERL
nr:hypothetical protein [Hyphomonas sp. Mor2]